MGKDKGIIVIVLIAVLLGVLGIAVTPNMAGAFVQKYSYSEYDPPGIFSGVWHGLLAPYSLIARWFIDEGAMYAVPNTGWFYDLGFLIGMGGSIPIGWIAAIISAIGHILL